MVLLLYFIYICIVLFKYGRRSFPTSACRKYLVSFRNKLKEKHIAGIKHRFFIEPDFTPMKKNDKSILMSSPKIRRILLFSFTTFWLLVGSLQRAQAQLDTEFWFAPPELTQSTNEQAPRDRPIQLVLSTLEKPAQVRILQPADLTFTPINVNIPANSTEIINLTPFLDRLESKPENTVLKTGLLIQSTASISAYYEIRSVNNTDIFTLKGANANGRLFFTPFQTHWNNSLANGNIIYNPVTFASFDIIATDDSTFVTVTPTKPLVGHPAGVPFTFMLNRGQVYSCRAADRFGANRPAGSKIESTKDIAVTVKDDMLQFNPPAAGADVAGDQITPVEFAGTDYVLVRGGLSNNNDRVYITATEDNTVVRLNGVAAPVAVLNQGQQYELVMAEPTYFLRASKKVYAWHISGIADQVGGALIPSLSCTGTNQIGFARTNSATFVVNVITRESAKNGFRLNGNPNLVPGSAFAPIQGSNGWVFARITFSTSQIPAGTTLLLQNNSDELFHVGVSNYAVGVGSNYGYFSNFSRLNLGTSKQLCIGDTAVLDAGPAKTQYIWNTGATSRFLETTIPGKYWVNTLSGTQCPKSDTVLVRFYTPSFNIGPDDTICIGESKLIQPDGVFTYTWQDGSTGNTFLATQPGIYWAQVADFQGCTTRDSLIIFEAPKPPTPQASGSDTVCKGQMVMLTMQGQSGLDFEWVTPGNQIVSGQNLNVATATSDGGKYYAFSKKGSCRSLPDSAFIGVNALPQVNLGRDTVFCGTSGSIVLDPGSHVVGQTYTWNTGNSDTSITVTQSGTYTVRVENAFGCQQSDTIQVLFQGPTQGVTFSGTSTACQGQNVSFGVLPEPGMQYLWTGPNGFSFTGANVLLSNAQPTQSGVYTVRPVLNGCAGNDTSRTITINQSPQISLGQDITTCLASAFVLDPIANGQGLSYLWNDGSIDSNLVVTNPGLYWVEVSNGICSNRDSLLFQTGVGPATVTFTGAASFCQNTVATFGVAEQNGETYSWTGPNGFTFVGASIELSNIQLNQGGTYTVVPSAEGCEGTPQSRTISVLPSPIANLGPDRTICVPGSLLLDPTPNGGDETFYVWSNGSADSTLGVTGPGTYHVLVTDGTCSSRDTVVLLPGQAPKPVTIQGDLIYCQGQTVNLSLTSQPGVVYAWTGPNGFAASDPNISILNAQPAQSGKYKVQSDLNGCLGTPDSVVVTIQPLPTVNLGPDRQICQGGSTVLGSGISGPGYTYLWNTGATDSTITVAAAGTYWVTVSGVGANCQNTDTIQVTFGVPPTSVTFQGLTTYCSGSPASFGVIPQNGIEYVWTGPSGFSFTGSQVQLATIQSNQAGTYFVVPKLGSCVGDTFSIQISISPGPIFSLGQDTTICGNQPFTLHAGVGQNGFTYEWNVGSTDSTLTVNQTGTYIVTVSNGGCVKSDTINLTFNPLPLPVTIQGSPNQCQGDTVILELQGTQTGVLYSWTGPNGFQQITNQVLIPAITPLSAGNYTVTPQWAGCAGIPTSINVSVFPYPIVQLGLDIVACEGTSFTLDPTPASAGLSFLWNTGSTDSNLVVSQTGTYWVRVQNAFNCVSRDSIEVTFVPQPLPVVFFGPSVFCQGSDATFGVQNSAGISYNWSGPNGFSFSGPTVSISFISATNGGYYKVVPVSGGTCIGQADSILIQVRPAPTISLGPDTSFCGLASYTLRAGNISGLSYLWNTGATGDTLAVSASGTYSVTASYNGQCATSASVTLTFKPLPAPIEVVQGSRSACTNQTVEFEVQPQPGATFTWQGPNGFASTGTSIEVMATATTEGSYTIRVEKDGCVGTTTASVLLNVLPLPSLLLNYDSLICKGTKTNVVATAATGSSYLWSDNSTLPTANLGVGTQWVQINLNGCLRRDTFRIRHDGPNADFTISPALEDLEVYKLVQFQSTSQPGNGGAIVSFVWDLGFSQIRTESQASYTYNVSGDVWVSLIVRDASGCADTARKFLSIKPVQGWFIPNLFTPNGDGANDTFAIGDLDSYPGTQVAIFNRWGQEEYRSGDYRNNWDGGNLVEGTYFYQVKRSDGQEFKGWVMLKR